MTARELAAGWPGGAHQRGEWWDVRCTAAEHAGDDHASASLTDDHERGRVRVVCRKGCSFQSIADGSPFAQSDFFHRSEGDRPPSRPGRARAAVPEACYDYRDETGALRHQTVRTRTARGMKGFYQRRPDGRGGWVNDLRDVETIIYRLDKLRDELAALPAGERFVAICEGEKDTGTLAALGIPATTNPMGAGKWRQRHTEQIRGIGAEGVYVFRDADLAGEAHAALVERLCQAAGLHVKRIILPGLEVLANKHGPDVTDWLQTHDPEELRAILKEARGLTSASTLWPTPVFADDEDHAPAGRGRTIDVSEQDLARVADAAWSALLAANNPPVVFRFAGHPVRVIADDHGVLLIEPLGIDELRHRLARVAVWTTTKIMFGRTVTKPAHPPIAVCRDMLAHPEPPLPRLARVVEVPIFTAAGRMIVRPGYDAESGVMLAPGCPSVRCQNARVLATSPGLAVYFSS